MLDVLSACDHAGTSVRSPELPRPCNQQVPNFEQELLTTCYETFFAPKQPAIPFSLAFDRQLIAATSPHPTYLPQTEPIFVPS